MEIISIGYELLIGKTLNSNATWLAKRASSLGETTLRITVVGDNADQISTAVAETLRRETEIVVTTGGLGPTFDDRTLEGIARAIGSVLELNGEAFAMVQDKYKAYLGETKADRIRLTPSRKKMARLPKGSKPLPNPVGTAPGVMISTEKTLLIALPGVPKEMKAIFEESVAPLLKRNSDGTRLFESSLLLDEIMESVLAPLIDQAMEENPCVYIKSHPKAEESNPLIEVHFSTRERDPKVAKDCLNRAKRRLTELVLMEKAEAKKT